jgi:hypothetical protein
MPTITRTDSPVPMPRAISSKSLGSVAVNSARRRDLSVSSERMVSTTGRKVLSSSRSDSSMTRCFVLIEKGRCKVRPSGRSKE